VVGVVAGAVVQTPHTYKDMPASTAGKTLVAQEPPLHCVGVTHDEPFGSVPGPGMQASEAGLPHPALRVASAHSRNLASVIPDPGSWAYGKQSKASRVRQVAASPYELRRLSGSHIWSRSHVAAAYASHPDSAVAVPLLPVLLQPELKAAMNSAKRGVWIRMSRHSTP
jgi:hypothetical protein